ncbi:SGNH hydrolase domain-containing protein [Streptomyces sp. NPDC102441]|uniref:SGNH hydrolase domain-containing protein n=1 Tax=Streptomyces sp. NPDC102441 TaxID=3366176 RepID=UPI0037F41E6B
MADACRSPRGVTPDAERHVRRDTRGHGRRQIRTARAPRTAARHPGAAVVVTSSDAGDPAHPAADPLHQWTTGYETTFRELAGSGTRVAALLDTPWPKGDPVDCAARNSLQLRACAHHLPKATRDATRGAAVRAAASTTATTVIDPTPWLCAPRTGTCPVVVGDTAVYRDGSHLSEEYAEALAPALAPLLDRMFVPSS